MSEYIIDGSDRRSTKAARNASIYEEREAGAKFIEIANKYRLSTERVRQIWRKEQWYRSRFDGLQPIVRCGDCKWSRIHDGKSYPGNKHKEYVGKMYCIAWGDGMQGEWTNPNGYCHRGKRRDA